LLEPRDLAVILTSDATPVCPPFPSLSDAPPIPLAASDRESRVKQSKVMIVDDEPLNIKILRRLLELEGFSQFVTTTESPTAISLIRQEQPDLVLLDLMMPYVSGLDILAEVRADESISFIPIVILTAITDRETRIKAVELGATDFLNKPVDASELLPRVRNVLAVKGFQDQLRNYNHDLEAAVRKQTAELENSHRDLVRCLAQAAEYRDDDTGHHVLRVGRYARLIGEALGFNERTLDTLEQAAQLHDIGKIGIPDEVLLKPGKLTEDEFTVMQKHANFGKRILARRSPDEEKSIRRHAEVGAHILEVGTSQLLDMARIIAISHHERWDGKGYPLGLQAEDIPLVGRIVAVADVFDALSSRRCYKEPFPIDKCFEIMCEQRGAQFDPAVIDAFFQARENIILIQLQFADEE
jgi:putative two-component system response regulator